MKDFEKIIGYEEIKLELYRTRDILINSEKYRKLGVNTPRGLMLYGEPGVGKTLMANCLIEASGRKSFICRKDKRSGDFVDCIKETFENAKKNAPSIILLDDIDKFANEDDNHRNAEEYVTVQSCIDDCKGYEVFVLATANNVGSLPPSLRRVGRFDKVIKVKNPKGENAVQIIKYYLSQKSYVSDVDVKEISRILDGGSCADLEAVVNEAGVYAGYAGKEKIDMDDMVKACMRVIFKAPESQKEVAEKIIGGTAYHEAGHAVVAEILEAGSVSLVSVQQHDGDVGGVTAYYQNENYFTNKKYMENRVICLLAGKAATEVVFGEVDVGSSRDIHRAFDIVERFVTEYCSTSFDKWYINGTIAENSRVRVETQIYSEMERYYFEAKRLLIKNREFLDKVAQALISKKTIIGKDISRIKAECKITD